MAGGGLTKNRSGYKNNWLTAAYRPNRWLVAAYGSAAEGSSPPRANPKVPGGHCSLLQSLSLDGDSIRKFRLF